MGKIAALDKIRDNIQKVIIGKDEVIDLLLITMISGGHALIEDVPGLGKTTLASALSSSLGCSFQRIQFTPDVLPSDITGYNTFNMATGDKEFHKGSIQNQIVLADEINRASPKTQSALLEAMQEHQVTVDGVTYQLPKPFMVLATQNPIDLAGTYPLPEAQLDRFLMKISLGYPSKDAEITILQKHRSVIENIKLDAVTTANEVMQIQSLVEKITVHSAIMEYIVRLVEATRRAEGVLIGCSPRASIALMQSACAKAILEGREYVLPEDVKYLAPYVLSHRIVMRNRSSKNDINGQQVVENILNTISLPKVRIV